ncbi:MAG: hybrid-cluster NAD(P)-dependent oxidoreductase [Burkholderia gladioli]
MMRDAANFEPVDSRVTQPEFWKALPELWTSDVEETLVCCHVRQETHDVRSFFFRSPSGRTFAFEPGQFVTLELDIDGETINRCYTISSSPARPHTLSITVKRVPGGKVSNWLHDNLQAGAQVRVLGPAGEFTCARHPARKFLFLSAGSGITPLMSMSRAHYDLAEDRDIVFVHSARTPDDIIFPREIDMIASSQNNFRTAFICERVGSRTNWPGVTGYLSLPLLKLIAPDFMEREIFTCGPAPYMKAVRDLLDEAGFDRKQYHEESFSFETMLDEAAPETVETLVEEGVPVPETTHFTVTFSKSNREISCGADQHVLEAARQSGVRLPSSCSQGMCGTCKVKLVSGQVEMKHNGGIRQREIDNGMVLLCCSKPLSDLVVEK